MLRGFRVESDALYRATGGKGTYVRKKHFKELGATASCVMRAVEAGKKITAFNDTEFFDGNGERGVRTGDKDDGSITSSCLDKSRDLLKDPERDLPELSRFEERTEGSKKGLSDAKVLCNL